MAKLDRKKFLDTLVKVNEKDNATISMLIADIKTEHNQLVSMKDCRTMLNSAKAACRINTGKVLAISMPPEIDWTSYKLEEPKKDDSVAAKPTKKKKKTKS